MPTLTSAIPQPCNASAGDSSAVAAPKPQSLAVKAVNICPYTPSTHSHIDWADDVKSSTQLVSKANKAPTSSQGVV